MLIGVLKTGILVWVGLCLFAIPAVLVSADREPETPRWINSTAFYENANACMWAGVAKEVCQSAQRSAYRQHVRVAPAYRGRAACEAAFAPGECFFSGASDLWTPWLSGFALLSHSRLPPPSSPDSHVSHELTARVSKSWWQYLQDAVKSPDTAADVRYFSEPLYWERDHQGGVHLTTLREKLRNDEGFVNPVGKRGPVRSQTSHAERQRARSYEPQRLMGVTQLD